MKTDLLRRNHRHRLDQQASCQRRSTGRCPGRRPAVRKHDSRSRGDCRGSWRVRRTRFKSSGPAGSDRPFVAVDDLTTRGREV